MRNIILALVFIMTISFANTFEAGNIEYENKNYEKAFNIWERLALNGDLKAQYKIGYMYDYGKGVEKNAKKAFYWYEKAANQGNVDAQDSLGFYYSLNKDYKKSTLLV